MKAFLTVIFGKASDVVDHGMNDWAELIVRAGKEKRPHIR